MCGLSPIIGDMGPNIPVGYNRLTDYKFSLVALWLWVKMVIILLKVKMFFSFLKNTPLMRRVALVLCLDLQSLKCVVSGPL